MTTRSVRFKNLILIPLSILAVTQFSACSKRTQQTDNGSTDLVQPQAVLSAKFDGKNWLFKNGVARDSLTEPDSFTVFLYESGDSAPDLCNYPVPFGESTIQFTIQKSTGAKPLGVSKAVVFNLGTGKKYEARDGAIWIDQTGPTLQGSLIANYDANNSASGSFVATICR